MLPDASHPSLVACLALFTHTLARHRSLPSERRLTRGPHRQRVASPIASSACQETAPAMATDPHMAGQTRPRPPGVDRASPSLPAKQLRFARAPRPPLRTRQH